MKKRMILICIFAVFFVLLFVFITVVNRAVVNKAEQSQIFNVKDGYSNEMTYESIVVLGAKVLDDGTPSHMLEDRLRAAVELYKSGAAKKIILSGDCSGEDYDEVSAMEKYCIDNGVPNEAIVRDDIGFSTYETMHNAVKNMGQHRIIIVTQKYHLYRAIYIAEELGAQADGFCADYRTYFGQIKRDVREYAARTKDFIKAKISK